MIRRIGCAFVLCGLVNASASAQPMKKIDLTPQTVNLETRDGVKLSGRYFPGRHQKQTVPVIILHGWKERASTYESLAKQVQSEEFGGHAVFVPDLRGHGNSISKSEPQRETPRELNAEKLVKSDVMEMIEFDVDAVKTFLLQQHNEGLLNIDMLCVIGSEMGAVVAMYWAAQDWSWPPLGGIRQGQDVKALVLISPPQNFKGVNIKTALEAQAVQEAISIIVFFGDSDRRMASHARRLHAAIEKYRPQKWESNEQRRQNQDLFLVPFETSLQGSKLLKEKSLKLPDHIHEFLDYRVTRRAEEFPWEARNLPTLGG